MTGNLSRDIAVIVVQDDIALRGNVSSTEDATIVFKGVAAANNPETVQEALRITERWSREGVAGRSLQIQFREPFSPQRASIAAMRAAYLAGFAILGYRYIATPDLEIVRRQIREPSDSGLKPLPVVFDATRPTTLRKILAIKTPDWMQSALAFSIGRHSTLLPSRIPDPEFFDRLAHAMSEHSDLEQIAVHCSGVEWLWPTEARRAIDFAEGQPIR